MIAFEVRHNGKKVCVAGLKGSGVLAMNMNRVSTAQADLEKVQSQLRQERSEPQMGFSVGGLATDGKLKDNYLRWAQVQLAVGDEVLVKIVEAKKADKHVSTTKTERKSPSLAAKKKQAKQLCAELGWTVVERTVDKSSRQNRSPKK